MLEKLIIKNFKSFKNETIFDFSKTNYTILPQNSNEEGILKGAIIIGPNASGKSTVIEAVKFLLDLLFRERLVNIGIYKCFFSSNPRFSLKYFFKINGKQIIYFIEIDISNHCVTEKLSLEKENNIIYSRCGDEAISKIADKNGIKYGKEDIDKDSLFLRTLYFNTKFAGNEDLKQWMEYLHNSIYIDAVNNRISYYGKEYVQLTEYLNNYGTDKINEFFKNHNFHYSIEYSNSSIGNLNSIELSESKNEKDIFFKRTDIQEPIPFVFESMGNKSLLKILPSYFHILNNKGMLLVDEFSSGFHPLLERMLIKNFMNSAKESQFIFVSHSVTLVSNSIMRPDQVYAVEFKGNDGSFVKRFSDLQPRTAQNIEKMYLAGIFGALPDYKEVSDETE